MMLLAGGVAGKAGLESRVALTVTLKLLDVHPTKKSATKKSATKKPAALSKEDDERKSKLVALMEQHGGNVTQVAKEMGVARMQIQRWLKRFGIVAGAFRA